MKKYKMYQLSSGQDSCRKRRSVRIEKITETTNTRAIKAGAVNHAIRGVLNGTLKKEDVKESLGEGIREAGYISGYQEELQLAQSLREVNRYLECEGRKPLPSDPDDVVIGKDEDGEEIVVENVNPLVFTREIPATEFAGEKLHGIERILEMEAVKVEDRRPSRPSDKQGNITSNLKVYALLKYLRKRVGGGQKIRLKASLYFLKKNNDSNSMEHPNFDADFFDTKNAGNVISYIEDYEKPAGEAYGADLSFTEADRDFSEAVEKFAKGIPENECSETDCKFCDIREICKWTLPPLASPPKKEAKSSAGVVIFTPRQKAVRDFDSGVGVVNAKPGTGKTFVMAYHNVSLLNKGFKPEGIFNLTFGNAASKELGERIALYAEDDGIAEDVDVTKIRNQTYNGFGNEIVCREYARFGYPAPPGLIKPVDRFQIVAGMLKDRRIKGIDNLHFDANSPICRGAVAMTAKVFEILKKERGFTIKDADKVYEMLGSGKRFIRKEAIPELYRLYREYDDRLRAQSLIEYADQEGLVLELLEEDPYYFEQFGFEHIMVDEFQDSSENQIRILRKLTECPSWKSMLLVGDDLQAIYAFRGTTPEYIRSLDRYIGKPVQKFELVENFRSTPQVFRFAEKQVENNRGETPKMVPTRPNGEPVVVKGFFDKKAEVKDIVEDIRREIESGIPEGSIAVIARTKSELDAVGSELAACGIATTAQYPVPYKDDSLVQASMALIRAWADEKDTKDLMIYANALRGGGIAEASKDEIDKAVEAAKSRLDALRAITDPEDRKTAFAELLEELDPKTPEFPSGRDSLFRDFANDLTSRPLEALPKYCDDFDRFGDDMESRREGEFKGVILTTGHSSKGLEYPVVHVMLSKCDKEELHRNSRTAVERTEEERRLLFVMSTRARDKLTVTGQWIAFGKVGAYTPNRFLIEAYNAAGGSITAEEVLRMKSEQRLIDAKRRELEKKKKKEAAAAEAAGLKQAEASA